MKGTESAKNTFGYWWTFFLYATTNIHIAAYFSFIISCCHGHRTQSDKFFFRWHFFYFSHIFKAENLLILLCLHWVSKGWIETKTLVSQCTILNILVLRLINCTKCCHKNYFVVTTIRIKVKSLIKNSARISYPFSSSNSTSVKFNRFVIFLGDKTFRIFLFDVRVYLTNQSIHQSILIPPKIKRHPLSYIYRLEDKKYVNHTVYK